MQRERSLVWKRGFAALVAAAVLLGGVLTLASHPAGADAQMQGCPLGSMSVCLMGVVERLNTWRTSFVAFLLTSFLGLVSAVVLWGLRLRVAPLAVRGVRLRVRSPGVLLAEPERDYLRANLARGLLHPKRF